MDPYRLVSLRSLGLALFGGCVAAAIAFGLNGVMRDALGLSEQALSRYAGPLVEELLKGAVVAVLLWRNRVGFLVDAAILGFASGAGFACVENLYLLTTRDLGLATWIVRGFVTAIIHGGATAVFAILAKLAEERRDRVTLAGLLPGLAAAFALQERGLNPRLDHRRLRRRSGDPSAHGNGRAL